MYKPYYENSNYLVFDCGEIFSLYSNKFLTHKLDKGGYHCVNIKVNGKTAYRRIHRMVAITFIDNPKNLLQVNHKDENKNNNNVSNLEWITPKDNCNYGSRNKRISKTRKGKPSNSKSGADNTLSKKVAQYTKDRKLINTYDNCRIACESVCPNSPHMRKAINGAALGKRKTAAGFIWRFI